MKYLVRLIFVCSIALGIGLFGCAKKAASSQEAIQKSQSMPTTPQKVDYLTQQANAFINSKEYQQAVDTAQYVLANLDKNSQAAKAALEKAKADLTAAAQKATSDAKNSLGGLLKK